MRQTTDVIGLKSWAERLQPAGNHVLPDRDVPLRLYVEDAEGLETPLTVYTWSEHQDDTNGNGIMEESEYKSMTANVNRGVLQAEVDLPLLDVDSILQPGELQGRLSVVIAGYDLAGNPLQSGGSFGEAYDVATILVQPSSNASDLNTVSGHYRWVSFPWQDHRLDSTIDGNGIDSLDSITLV